MGYAHQDLLVAVAGRDGARVFQQTIAQRALAMVDVGDDAEVAISVNRDGGDASLEFRGRRFLHRFGSECASRWES